MIACSGVSAAFQVGAGGIKHAADGVGGSQSYHHAAKAAVNFIHVQKISKNHHINYEKNYQKVFA